MKKHLHGIIGLATISALCGALLLNGCARQTRQNGGGNSGNPATPAATASPPTPSPTPSPTPIPMDTVERILGYHIQVEFLVDWNGWPLSQRGLGVGQSQNLADGVDVYVPIRALGEKLGRRVVWNYKRRRVTFDSETVPRPVALFAGRSYLRQETVEGWLGCRGDFQRVTRDSARLYLDSVIDKSQSVGPKS